MFKGAMNWEIKIPWSFDIKEVIVAYYKNIL